MVIAAQSYCGKCTLLIEAQTDLRWHKFPGAKSATPFHTACLTSLLAKETQKDTGIKYDTNKPEWYLLPLKPIEEIVKVLTHGAEKYGPDNWKKVKPQHRYYNAMMRHIRAYQDNEWFDPDSGLPHLAHAGCCLIFLLWFGMEDRKQCQKN